MNNIEHVRIMRTVTTAQETLVGARFKETYFTRKRKMQFPDAISFMMDMRKTTLQTRLNLYFEHTKGGDPISQQAFSKLRMKFDHSPFEKMVRIPVKEEYSGRHDLPLWNGFHVLAVDGSYLQLPCDDSLRKEYGIRGGGNRPSAGISVLYDVLHGWALDPIITHTKMNERTECVKHIQFLCQELPNIAQNSIVTLDRGYPSLNILEELQTSGLKFIARCSSNFIKEIAAAPLGDTYVTLKNNIYVRVIKFILPTGAIETLITNLFELGEDAFPEIYSLRWGIETAYFRLKRELSVEKFSGETPNAIRQDFWASMALLNVVATFQKEANVKVNKRQIGKALKHANRARTSDLIVTLRDRFIFAVLCDRPMFSASEMELVITTMARVVSPIRPGRHYDRSFKPDAVTCQNLKSRL